MRSWLAAAVLIGGCYSPSIKLGVPCSDAGDCPGGQQCDPITNLCLAPTELFAWRDDTAADFSGSLTSAIVEPGGFVSPRPYATGRVRLSGIASDTIGALATASWATASNGPVTGRGFATGLDLNYDDLAPFGLGLATGDNVTVLIEGEINLDQTGAWRFELDANDKGFLELATTPGSATFVRLVADMNANTQVNHTVTQAGWHAFRAAFTDAAVIMSFALLADPPPTGGLNPVELDRLRAPVDDLTGYVVDGFDAGGMIGYSGSTLDTQPLERTLSTDALGIPVGTVGFSFRWSAQILIETGGDYAFDITSFQGHRMWIDGMQVANDFATTALTSSTSTPVQLEPGWHDFVVDISKEDDPTSGQLTVKVASGPQWVGQPVPIDHVRPVVARSQRWTAGQSFATVAIADGTMTPRTVTVPVPLGFVPASIEAGYELTHPVHAQVQVVLDPPAGSNVTLLATGAKVGSGTHNDHQAISNTSFGTTWQFEVSDSTVDAMTGSITLLGVTVLGSGGVAPFPTEWRYESAVRELGNVVGFGPLTWQLRQGTTATVQMRSCDDAAACASEMWTTVSHGAVPPIATRRFAQYAVSVATAGDIPTALDWVELAYSARPE